MNFKFRTNMNFLFKKKLLEGRIKYLILSFIITSSKIDPTVKCLKFAWLSITLYPIGFALKFSKNLLLFL